MKRNSRLEVGKEAGDSGIGTIGRDVPKREGSDAGSPAPVSGHRQCLDGEAVFASFGWPYRLHLVSSPREAALFRYIAASARARSSFMVSFGRCSAKPIEASTRSFPGPELPWTV